MTIVNHIKEEIEKALKDSGKDKKFIIYSYGDIGMQVKQILNECYGIEAAYIIDNHLCNFNPRIYSSDLLKTVDADKYIIFITTLNENFADEIKKDCLEYWQEENIISLINKDDSKVLEKPKQYTKVGKYSYGPLCNHPFVKEVGAFTSIAEGAKVVANHSLECITVHPIVYHDKANYHAFSEWTKCNHANFYMEGIEIKPHGKVKAFADVEIGNDVWIGQNVIITNGACIGDGAIVAAGAVVTKDVQPYAVVAGVPARIMRYRYTPEQIEALQKIQWWNWSDEVIRERYEDLYLPIEEFLEKYKQTKM